MLCLSSRGIMKGMCVFSRGIMKGMCVFSTGILKRGVFLSKRQYNSCDEL